MRDEAIAAELSDEELLRRAKTQADSLFDYVIVGSGAGGGPLAARLALAGMRVLVLDAGGDGATEESETYPEADAGEIYGCPGYHAAATEDYAMSWQFSVRHYADDAQQRRDEKYDRLEPPDPRFLDPSRNGGAGKGGIFYPRSASLGGCTSHHAMIVAAPNDRDWDAIANLTGDESWRATRMRGYFARLERCLYVDAYNRWFQRLLGPLYKLWQRFVLLFNPRALLDEGGHGRNGWQPTSFIDPDLVENIRERDRGFLSVLMTSALAVLHSDSRLTEFLKRSLVWLRIVQHIDPNDFNTRRTSPEGVYLIPTGIESGPDRTGSGQFGRRKGVREFLLETRDLLAKSGGANPGRLVIQLRTHATRVLFEAKDEDPTPKAIGVEAVQGSNLYEASPLRKSPPDAAAPRVRYFARREVILCGGAFNTPQLLMLSGIGPADELARFDACVLSGADGKSLPSRDGLPRRIELEGVGRNLQDRYEVSVISELDQEFATLEGATFVPGDSNDPIRSEYRKTRGGLYRTNGGTLAVLHRSSALGPDEPEPDLFSFGVPAAFRGYYFGWSRELLRRTIDASSDQRNLWSWVILKAYTRNEAGRVTLRSDEPFDQPEICFDSFNEQAERRAQELARELALIPRNQAVPEPLAAQIAANAEALANSKRDLDALVDAIAFMRRINARNPRKFVREIQPGPALADGSRELADWVRTQAWGHHASCTCRIGSDAWQQDPSQLSDRHAVLDSRFQVHGVKGLRVVDASVFPDIPGYFILTPILMISEKAADVLLAERGDEVYAPAFEAKEAAAVRARRAEARVPVRPNEDPAKLPSETVGLALSGGGIRSATFALGVLQALAEKDRLREIDYLSTVSGGGFIGSFLGRLFTRELVTKSADPAGRVQETLKDSRSSPIRWLRRNANYIFATGTQDLRQNLAVFWQGLSSVYVVLGALVFASLGALVWLSQKLPTTAHGVAIPSSLLSPFADLLFEQLGVRDWLMKGLPKADVAKIPLSPWWWLPFVVFALGVVPVVGAFWLSQRAGSYRPYPYAALGAWVVLLAGALGFMQTSSGLEYASWGAAILLLSWVWQDVARVNAAPTNELDDARRHAKRLEQQGSLSPAQRAELEQKEVAVRQQLGNIVRNRLIRALGETLALFGALVVFVVLDSLALQFAMQAPNGTIAALTLALAPALPLLRQVGMGALRQISGGKEGFSLRTARLFGLPIAIVLLLAMDVLAHRIFHAYPREAKGLILLGIGFSLVIGRAFSFLNLSSIRAAYAARLSRTFLGASNPERVYGATNDDSKDVQSAHPQDDVPHERYHPEKHGGPLHLINVCINETVDAASEREIRERKGISMCVTPHGVTVGRRYFAEWTRPDDLPRWMKRRRWRSGLDAEDDLPPYKQRSTALRALIDSSDPNAFHVLKTKGSDSAEVEPLSLGAWTAISGAAFSTGTGRQTSLPLSLFMGLLNVRLGYWWDSGIKAGDRPGRYPLPLWRRLKRAPNFLFAVQNMLLSEWRGRFRGPSDWFWYLSDGGHFEVTGVYELLRRRVRFVIVTDAGEDPGYAFGDVAQLAQQVRIDFGAEIDWLELAPGTLPDDMPEWIEKWIDPAALGAIASLARESAHSASLARVRYGPGEEPSWILLIKPSLFSGMSQDVRNYSKQNTAFPQDSTFDQVFDDSQWESYRALGHQIGTKAVKEPR
ncbi:MAG TPA: GMC oxidoreductase [Myxococcota bacterium]|nr:GMC oxidoreductase [Myxococcota bacterium]